MQEKCHQYWPSDRSARYQYFVVDPMAEYNMPQYILREFKVTDARVCQALIKTFKISMLIENLEYIYIFYFFYSGNLYYIVSKHFLTVM